MRIASHPGKYTPIEYFLIATIAQVSKEPLDHLQRLYGGTIYARPAKGKRQRIWDLRIYGAQVMAMLSAMLPYLTVKREEAALVLSEWKMPGRGVGHAIGADGQEIRRQIMVKMKDIKTNYGNDKKSKMWPG